jgi:hypothetical protein
MKRSAILACFTAVFIIAADDVHSQSFKKFYGTSQYEEFWGSVVLGDGSIVHAGYSTLNGYIIRTNAMGDTLWSRRIPEPNWGLIYSVQKCSDQAIIIAGRSSSYGAGLMDVYLMKLDLLGNILWRKAIGTAANETANEVKVCKDKGFLIAGYTKVSSTSNHSNDAYVVKTDSLGNIMWTRAFHGYDNSNAYDIAEMINGDIMVTGLTIEPSIDVFIARLGPAGNVKWMNKYGGAGDDRGMELVVNAQCEIYVTGLYNASRMLLMKVDSSGNLKWSKSYGGASNQWSYSICEAGGGNFAICGYDYVLIKVDKNGDTLWTRSHGASLASEYAQKVNKASNGGYVITGYSNRSQSGNYDLLVVLTDSLGNTNCETGRPQLSVNPLTIFQSPSSLTVTSLGAAISVSSSAVAIGTVEVVCVNSVSLEEHKFTDRFHLSPNPTSGILRIAASDMTGLKKINITNSLGQIVGRFEWTGDPMEISVSRLDIGIYMIILESDAGTYSKKFIKIDR